MAWTPTVPPAFFDGQEVPYQTMNNLIAAIPFVAAGTAVIAIGGSAEQSTTITLPTAPAGRTEWIVVATPNNTDIVVAYTGGTTLAAKRVASSAFTGSVTLRWQAVAI